jgi:hypothetical protein
MPTDLATLQESDTKKNRRKAILTVLLVSLGIHVAGGFGAAVWVVARYFNPPAATFVAKKDPTRLAAQDRQHKLDLASYDGLAPKPSFSDRIASTRPGKLALPEMPRVPMDQLLALDPSTMISDQVTSFAGSAGFGSGGFGGDGSGGQGRGRGAGTALKFPKMKFFGISDEARSVVIMIDVSDSMFTRTGDAEGRNLVKHGKEQSFQTVRDEAIQLVQNLSVNARFGIVRWSGGAYSWKPELVPATDENKAAAVQHIQNEVDMKSARPYGGRPGGTRHDYALEEAFKLKPEVIFMITDGNATAAQPGGGLTTIPPKTIWDAAELGQKSMEHAARLHVIYYITGQDKTEERAMLGTLARRNEGRFRQMKAPGAK